MKKLNNSSGCLKVEVQAPINIALIKYWGKRNEELILPLNDSISLSINELMASTTIECGPNISKDSISLNGEDVDFEAGSRFRRVFDEVRRISQKNSTKNALLDSESTNFSLRRNSTERNSLNDSSPLKPWHIRVTSKTNFPIAVGLASSAAGFAAIAVGLGRLFQLPDNEIVRLARIGSGSACRSVKDGFVHWKAGTSNTNDQDCCCETIMPSTHWDSLRAIIIVLNDTKKKVGSSVGMRNTVRTSSLLNSRLEMVPKRVSELRQAIIEKNFAKLAEITMTESNQLHAVCLDTYPPLKYMNSDSHLLIEFVHNFNEAMGETKLAYTFDAGPNCCLLMEEETLELIYTAISHYFTIDAEILKKFEESFDLKKVNNEKTTFLYNNLWQAQPQPIQIQNIICSKVGLGPRLLSYSTTTTTVIDNSKHPSAAIGHVDCKVL